MKKQCYTHQNTKRKQKESIRQPINGRKLKEQKKENKVRQNCKHSKQYPTYVRTQKRTEEERGGKRKYEVNQNSKKHIVNSTKER